MDDFEFIPRSGLRLYQDDVHFRLGADSVYLAAFTRFRKNSRVCDLGCGGGALALLALSWEPTVTVDGLDILPSAVEIARKNIDINGLQGRFAVNVGDIIYAPDLLPGGYDTVVTNPPYFTGGGAVSADDRLAKARHGEGCTPEVLCRSASRLLKNGGSFSIVYRCEALVDIMQQMRSNGIEPKRLRLVCHTADSAPKIFLLEGRKGGKPGLDVEPPLIRKTPDGQDTDEVKRIYSM